MICNNMTNDSPPPDSTDHAPAPDAGGDEHQALIAQAQRVRGMVGSKRSDKLLRLFDFLLEQTIAGRSPSEVDIANEAFSIGPVVDTPQDATVRVYVHRLRKSLELAQADMPGPKLAIPKGEYRLVLGGEDDREGGTAPAAPDAPAPVPVRPTGPRRSWLVGALLVLIANVLLWVWLLPDLGEAPRAPLARTPVWRALGAGERPITLVMGDYYLFAQSADGRPVTGGPRRLVRDPSINGREDLDIYLMARPQERDRIGDYDMRYVPSSILASLGDIFAALRTVEGQAKRRVTLIPASQLTTDLLKSTDIIYVGQMSGLGTLLRNPVFQASGFRIGATYDEWIDTATGRRFQSDGGLVLADERVGRRDFGYLAAFPGPSGNHLVVIAGARDAAVRQMAEIADDAARLGQLAAYPIDGAQGFEALYQVRTLGTLNISGQLLIARRLRSGGIWDRATPSQRFPNDDFEGEGRDTR